MGQVKIENYDFKNRLISPVFLCWVLFPYYIDIWFSHQHSFENLGIWLRYTSSYGFDKYAIQDGLVFCLYPAFLLYVLILFHFSIRAEKSINESYKKLLPFIFGVMATVIIIGKIVLIGRNPTWLIVEKLAWCWVISILLLSTRMFKRQNG